MHPRQQNFIGRPMSELPTPSLVISQPVLNRNVHRLHQAVEDMGISFRPHVKTLKVHACVAYSVLVHTEVLIIELGSHEKNARQRSPSCYCRINGQRDQRGAPSGTGGHIRPSMTVLRALMTLQLIVTIGFVWLAYLPRCAARIVRPCRAY